MRQNASPILPFLPPFLLTHAVDYPHSRIYLLASSPTRPSANEETSRKAAAQTTPRPDNRRRWHPRQAPHDRTKRQRFRENSLQPFHDRRHNGSRRQEKI